MNPYVVIPDEGGHAATVLDRESHQRIGRLLQNYWGSWEAVDVNGLSLGLLHYRHDAADTLWAEYSR